jgi:hypothetical protein
MIFGTDWADYEARSPRGIWFLCGTMAPGLRFADWIGNMPNDVHESQFTSLRRR